MCLQAPILRQKPSELNLSPTASSLGKVQGVGFQGRRVKRDMCGGLEV